MKFRCYHKFRHEKRCWGILKELDQKEEFADFICPVCGSYFNLDYLEEQRDIENDGVVT